MMIPVGVESSRNVLSKDCLSFHFIHLTHKLSKDHLNIMNSAQEKIMIQSRLQRAPVMSSHRWVSMCVKTPQ